MGKNKGKSQGGVPSPSAANQSVQSSPDKPKQEEPAAANNAADVEVRTIKCFVNALAIVAFCTFQESFVLSREIRIFQQITKQANNLHIQNGEDVNRDDVKAAREAKKAAKAEKGEDLFAVVLILFFLVSPQ